MKPSPSFKKSCRTWAVGTAIVLAGSFAAQAQTAPGGAPGQGVSLQAGFNSDYKRLTLAYETPALWSHRFDGGSRLDLSVELAASYWNAKRGAPDTMWQAAATPMLRWWPRDAFYLELGVGPSMLSRSEFGGRELSTRFQFTSHFGTGIVINKAHRLGLRYTHVSNASIKKPNPGLDLVEVAYTYQF